MLSILTVVGVPGVVVGALWIAFGVSRVALAAYGKNLGDGKPMGTGERASLAAVGILIVFLAVWFSFTR